MSSCDCEKCEAWRDRDREEYRRNAEAIRRGLARLGQAVALWGAMASASKGAIAHTAGDAGGIAADFLHGALRYDFTAEDARARPHVENVIAAPHGFLIVLHHEQAVSLVPQGGQGVEQGHVVARMQADGRFVEHVEHAAQIGTQLRSKADPLALAAAERDGAATQLQIAEADFVEEFQALCDFGEDVAGDQLPGAGEGERAQFFGDTANRESR